MIAVAVAAALLLPSLALASLAQQVHVQPYGENAVRVRIFPSGGTPSLTDTGYLLPPPGGSGPGAWLNAVAGASAVSGNIEAVATPSGFVIRRVSDHATLLAQDSPVAVGAASADGRAPMNVTARVCRRRRCCCAASLLLLLLLLLRCCCV
jgi:hypothetical protein